MGTRVNAQTSADNEYVNAIKTLCTLIVAKGFSVWKAYDALFQFSPSFKTQKAAQRILHGFTNSVIEQRHRYLLEENTKKQEKTSIDDDVGVKKKFVFLDLLLNSVVDGKPLSYSDIREEVDTFMFDGHDTTASGICFALYELSRNPEAQNKAIAELREIFGNDIYRSPTIHDLNNMKYIELIIKEALRMYPSVPFFGRKLDEDVIYKGTLYQKGLSLMFIIYHMHRKPELFPNPNKFIPERFLSENMKTKNPFSYIPFSAGPRNCIGQKFAMYELKASLSKVLRHFELLPAYPDVELSAEIILKSANGVSVQLKHRIY